MRSSEHEHVHGLVVPRQGMRRRVARARVARHVPGRCAVRVAGDGRGRLGSSPTGCCELRRRHVHGGQRRQLVRDRAAAEGERLGAAGRELGHGRHGHPPRQRPVPAGRRRHHDHQAGGHHDRGACRHAVAHHDRGTRQGGHPAVPGAGRVLVHRHAGAPRDRVGASTRASTSSPHRQGRVRRRRRHAHQAVRRCPRCVVGQRLATDPRRCARTTSTATSAASPPD